MRGRRLALWIAPALAALLLWANRRPPQATPSPPPAAPAPALLRERAAAPAAASTLLQQASSAYHARLFVDEDALVLVTQSGFALLRDGQAPEQHAIDLGPIAIRQGASILFWRAGALLQISLDGADERRLASLARPPQYLLASARGLAWIDTRPGAGGSLEALSAGAVRAVHQTPDRVCAAVLREASVYAVLQSPDGSWRIQRVDLDGRQQQQTEPHQGRPPALLALGPDGVYFYDGPERGVRRASFELDREESVLKNVICSPLDVSDRVVCAQVGGLFDIPAPGNAPRFLTSERAGPITTLAATEERVYWVAENGTDQLVLRSLPLPPP
jgi:hypothetical protein